MQLSSEQLQTYEDLGYLLVPNCFSEAETDRMRTELRTIFDRALFAIRYNSVKNLPLPVENPRPEFQASRDYTPIEPLSSEVLSV